MDHHSFIKERGTARILEIISGILDGGEGVGEVCVDFGAGISRNFLGFF